MYDTQHVTSSPHNPQGNGHAERAVQTAKRILKQDDPVVALMCFRATPIASTGVSPAELLMGRKMRTTLPTLPKNLRPKWPNKSSIKERDKAAKEKQAYYFNRRHGVKDLPVLRPGDSVLLKLDNEAKWKGPATVLAESATPRSYEVFSEKEGRKGEIAGIFSCCQKRFQELLLRLGRVQNSHHRTFNFMWTLIYLQRTL